MNRILFAGRLKHVSIKFEDAGGEVEYVTVLALEIQGLDIAAVRQLARYCIDKLPLHFEVKSPQQAFSLFPEEKAPGPVEQ